MSAADPPPSTDEKSTDRKSGGGRSGDATSSDPRAGDQEQSVALMRRLARGDESALEELYERWAGPLLSFLYGMCRDRALAEDLMQGVFLRVWKAAPRYEPLAKYSTWLFQIARNHFLNEREKRMRRIRPVSLDGGDADGDGRPSLSALVADHGPSPEAAALSGELGEHIQAAVERLPEKLRSVWMLGAAQGLPYADVAEVLEIPVGTVKSRMFQAVRLLRAELAPYVDGCADPDGTDSGNGAASSA